MSVISFENLKQIITDQKLRWFELLTYNGTQRLGASTEEDGSDSGIDTKPLIENLEKLVGNCGDGNYKIFLKKSPKSQSNQIITHYFRVGQDQQIQPLSGMNGFTADSVKDVINTTLTQFKEVVVMAFNEVKAVNEQIMRVEKEKAELQRQFDLEKNKTVEKTDTIAEKITDGLTGIGAMAGLMIAHSIDKSEDKSGIYADMKGFVDAMSESAEPIKKNVTVE